MIDVNGFFPLTPCNFIEANSKGWKKSSQGLIVNEINATLLSDFNMYFDTDEKRIEFYEGKRKIRVYPEMVEHINLDLCRPSLNSELLLIEDQDGDEIDFNFDTFVDLYRWVVGYYMASGWEVSLEESPYNSAYFDFSFPENYYPRFDDIQEPIENRFEILDIRKAK